MKITAAVADELGGQFRTREVEVSEIRPDELIVEIRSVGLCHTDIAARDGVFGLSYPVVLGHEGSGVVVDVGSKVSNVAPGDQVVLSFNSCGECTSCINDNPAYCCDHIAHNYTGTRTDGSHPLHSDDGAVYSNFFGQSSFASHAVANQRNVVKVDPDLDTSMLGPLGCGLQTGAGAVMRSLECTPGSSLLVLGGGSVGLAAVMGARIQGCSTITISEPYKSRRELALELGATHVIDPTSQDLAEAVRETVEDGVNYCVDTTGAVSVIQDGLRAMAPNGVFGLVGVPGDFSVNLPLNIVSTLLGGLTVKGVVEGDSDRAQFIPELLRHYRAGEFPFDKLVQKYPLSRINEAVQAQHRGDVVKVVLLP